MSHYQARAEKRKTPVCPVCGNLANERPTQFGIRSWCCGLWSWDRYPLVDSATHAARREAHVAFDALWKEGLVSRSKAYSLLRQQLGISKSKCHMKLMDAQTAGRVPDAVLEIRLKLARRGVVGKGQIRSA